MLNVTRTHLPPLEKYVEYLKEIWDSRWVTNHGPCVTKLEARLREYLETPYLFFVTNGTVALQLSIKALGLQGEVITSPFSYVATVASLAWEGCTPVFADIDPATLTLAPTAAARLVTSRTTAIMATHVYGIPCDVDGIREFAAAHNLRVIYDAAHAFGVRYRGIPLAHHGDLSYLSFHATKVFHTVEGGAIVTTNEDLAHRLAYMRNFGHRGTEGFWGLGINGKNSELHAAMGLCLLDDMPNIIDRRRQCSELYDELLSHLGRPRLPAEIEYNYAYYPVLFNSEDDLLRVQRSLNSDEIFPRRYFYPALNALPYVAPVHMPVAEDVARRVLCLPLYADLAEIDVRRTASLINATLG